MRRPPLHVLLLLPLLGVSAGVSDAQPLSVARAHDLERSAEPAGLPADPRLRPPALAELRGEPAPRMAPSFAGDGAPDGGRSPWTYPLVGAGVGVLASLPVVLALWPDDSSGDCVSCGAVLVVPPVAGALVGGAVGWIADRVTR